MGLKEWLILGIAASVLILMILWIGKNYPDDSDEDEPRDSNIQ